MEDAAPPSSPIGFAHRGGMAHRPENTMSAFSHALALGARALESDVWCTADEVAVLDHDGLVRRSGRRSPIGEVGAADLPRHVLTLAQLYETCGIDFELSLDVKDDHAAEAAMTVADQHGALGRLWLCSPSRRQLKRWRELSGEVRLVDSVPIRTFRDDPEARIAALGPLGLDALNARHPTWTPERIAAVHAEGKLAFAWDVQSRARLDQLIAQGIDGLFSDHIDRLVASLRAGRSARSARPG